MALARLSLLKSGGLLGIGNTDFDNVLKALLMSATKIAETYTGRQLESATVTEYHTGDGGSRLYPRQYPITSVTSVSFWDGTDSYDAETSTYYTLVDSRYIQYPALGQSSSATFGNWTSTYENGIELVYVAGYVTTDWDTEAITTDFNTSPGVPADLEMAVARIAAIMWKDGTDSGESRLGVNTMTRPGGDMITETFERGIPRDVRLILDQYRRLG